MKVNNIDQLKAEWSKLSNDNLKQKLSHSEIAEITRKKSKHEIDVIKRKFLIESLIGLPILIFVFILVNYRHEGLVATGFNIFMSITLLILIIPLLRLFKIGKLKDQSISVFLNKAVPIFKQVLSSLIILSAVICPIGFISGILVGFMEGSGRTDLFEVCTILINKLTIFGVIGLLGLCSFSGYFLIKYYYKLVYKRNIDNLEQLMIDLNKKEEETED